MLKSAGASDEECIRRGVMLVLGREASADEVAILADELRSQRDYFKGHPEAATAFVAVGESKPDESADEVELAAMASVARVLLNLDETLTKE